MRSAAITASRGKPSGRGPRERGGTERLGDIVSALLQKRAYARPLALGGMREAWSRAAGERLSRSTRVAGWRDGTLVVEVPSASQRYELENFHAADLLSALQRDTTIPRVTRLVFRIGNTSA